MNFFWESGECGAEMNDLGMIGSSGMRTGRRMPLGVLAVALDGALSPVTLQISYY